MADEKLVMVMQKGFETLADLIRETNSRLDETNARLDLDVTIGRLDVTIGRLDATIEQVKQNGRGILEVRDGLLRLESRFDNLIEIAGTESRRLWGRGRSPAPSR